MPFAPPELPTNNKSPFFTSSPHQVFHPSQRNLTLSGNRKCAPFLRSYFTLEAKNKQHSGQPCSQGCFQIFDQT